MSDKEKLIAHVRWEFPFPIMLPDEPLLCWEPQEGVAAFVPEGRIGSIQWHRQSTLFLASEIFEREPIKQDQNVFPKHSYRIVASAPRTKKEVIIAELVGGADGGFIEARPYTVANIFLFVSNLKPTDEVSFEDRANLALNNIIDIYRLFSLDPQLRPMHENDHYYTVITKAALPDHLAALPLEELFSHIEEFHFSDAVGKGRTHKIGINSIEDLAGIAIAQENMSRFHNQVRHNIQLELFHQLIFSAIRRLKRKEEALAIIDAQSAFESVIAVMLREALSKTGWDGESIEKAFEYPGKLHLLTARLNKIDEIATASGASRFLGTPLEKEWRKNLYDLRNEIVHGGRRTVSFIDAKRGIVACLKAISFINFMCPAFQRRFMWIGMALDLPHIRESAGRLTRIFET